MSTQKFDPFADRLSRDIRNRLSRGFVRALEEHDLEFAGREERKILQKDPVPIYRAYVDETMARYRRAFALVEQRGIKDVFSQGLVLWDLLLFFEVHELLEHLWLQASGARRKALQGFIQAAGVYIHLRAGNIKGAERLAAKAVSLLRENGHALPSVPGFDELLARLKRRDPEPPGLTAG